MAISSFRDLRVWQAGMDLVEKVYLKERSGALGITKCDTLDFGYLCAPSGAP